MSEAMTEEKAVALLARMEAYFGESLTTEDRAKVIAAIQSDRLSFDEGKGEITYMLAKPLQLLNKDQLLMVTFHEPTNDELKKINDGMTVSVDASTRAIKMDMGDVYTKNTRILTELCGVPLGVVGRIMRRDVIALGAICSFFG